MRPAAVHESVCVNGRMWRVAVDGEGLEVRTTFDEHIPESVVARYWLVCVSQKKKKPIRFFCC